MGIALLFSLNTSIQVSLNSEEQQEIKAPLILHNYRLSLSGGFECSSLIISMGIHFTVCKNASVLPVFKHYYGFYSHGSFIFNFLFLLKNFSEHRPLQRHLTSTLLFKPLKESQTYPEHFHDSKPSLAIHTALWPARFPVCKSNINISPTFMFLLPDCPALYLMHWTIISSGLVLVE